MAKRLITVAGLLLGSIPIGATCQLPAFPGAEGGGKYAKGGRGGDVYIVTNLQDSGAGSLRNGISTATGPRTIVFGISGEIQLQSPLNVNKNNITVAGQTAPEGGITLSRHRAHLTGSDIIFQHVSVRLGDDNYVPDTGESDAITVVNSNNVIVDHVSTAWSTDEVLSVTKSENVTVQWSFITEALKRPAGSSENHGYGSIVVGENISYHHNLYAHNQSRNPRAGQDLDGSVGSQDFVNNVIYNPGGRYGYSGVVDFDFNLVANFGIAGPNTTASSLFNGGGVDNRIYQRDNYLDNNKNIILNLNPAGTSALSGTYTTRPTRANVTEISNETDAPTAYNQVMSYAGASKWRDSIDKRIVQTVFNRRGAHINSQNEVGGFADIPSNTMSLDSDGIPDAWKVANGYDPEDESIGFQFGSDGYTILEKYLHDLSAEHLPSTNTKSHILVSTDFANGADAKLSENGGISSGDGDGPIIDARWYTNFSSRRNEYVMLKFDLHHIQPGSIEEASLDLTVFRQMGSENVRVYGLVPDNDSQSWDESEIEFATAPGLEFDGDLTTRGRVAEDWLTIGQFATDSVGEGSTIQFTDLNLATYLNQLRYRDSTDSTVTLLLERITNAGVLTQFASKEATHLESTPAGSVPAGTYAPRLRLLAEGLPGDYNFDGVVNAADYGVWLLTLGSTTDLRANGDNTGASANRIDLADYHYWKQHLGNSSFDGSDPSASALANVPEPTGHILLVSAFLMSCLNRNSNSVCEKTVACQACAK